jgi:hypothetical protein
MANTPTRWQKTEILVRHTIFNGKNIHKCAALAIQPFAAIFNVTITDSDLKIILQFADPNTIVSFLHFAFSTISHDLVT